MSRSYSTADVSATQETVRRFSIALWDPHDLIEIRHLPSGQSTWHPAEDLPSIVEPLEASNENGKNIHVGANPRRRKGRKNTDVGQARCVFADFDKTSVDDARRRIKAAGLPDPTVIVASGHGAHSYWRLTAAMEDLKEWSALQRDLAALLGSDPLHDPARLMRLPGFMNLKDPPAPCELVSCDPKLRYAIEVMRAAIPPRPAKPATSTANHNGHPHTPIPEGKRNSTLTSLAGTMVKRGMTVEAIRAALPAENAARCVPPLPEAEVTAIVNSVLGYAENAGSSAPDLCPYVSTSDGLAWVRQIEKKILVEQLTSFTATITADVVRDDGSSEIVRAFEIQAGIAGRRHTFTVPADEYGLMMWPAAKLGATAVVYPGYGLRDRARAAIQLVSPQPIPERRLYTHTGWRPVNDEWVYLHAGGAIGAAGVIAGVAVELPDAISRFVLPPPPAQDELVGAIRASLGFLELGPPEIMFPMYGAIWRAVLGECDMAIHMSGPTGVFKSEVAALLQQHWGAGFDARHLPAGWHSTDNALEGLLFAAKDAITVVDDFAPTGSQYEVAKFHQRADRVIRAQGNRSGRGRMRPDGSLRPVKPPRGLMVSTGEETPRGQSLRSRMFVVEISRGDIDPNRLLACQSDARAGLYAIAMSGFIRWLAGSYDKVRRDLRIEIEELRAQAVKASEHRRTPEIVANLAIGVRYFLRYARGIGAISKKKSDAIWQRAWDALGQAANRQSAHQLDCEPATRFIELITSAINTGRAHLVGPDGNQPPLAKTWGWTVNEANADWQPRGECVGFVDGNSVYLDPDASYRVAQVVAGTTGNALCIQPYTLRRRLAEKEMIVRPDDRDELTVRRIFRGRPQRFLLFTPGILRVNPPNPPNPPFEPGAEGGSGGSPASLLSSPSIQPSSAPSVCVLGAPGV